jgi:hypothetical protein
MAEREGTDIDGLSALDAQPAWRTGDLHRLGYPVGHLLGAARLGQSQPVAPPDVWATEDLKALAPVGWRPSGPPKRSQAYRRRRQMRRRQHATERGRPMGPPRVRRMPYFRAWLATLPPGTRVRPSEVARMFGVTIPRIRRLFMWALESGALVRLPPQPGQRFGAYVVPGRRGGGDGNDGV